MIPQNDPLDGTPSNRLVNPFYRTRRYARVVALRAVYAQELKGCSVTEVMSDPLVNDGRPCPSYSGTIINLVFEKRDIIDERIREKVQRWEFHRLAVVDRCILRISTAELFFVPDVPPKVVINEAIELAKKFSTEQSGRFINGILDAIYEDIRKGRWVINEGVTTPR